MKTFTFTIELTDEEITNTFMYLASIGVVDKDSTNHEESVFNYAKAKQAEIYNNLSTNVVDFLVSQLSPSIAIPPKEIGGTIS